MIDFQVEVLDASFRQPVLVDFHAAWCGPCRALAPVIAELVRRSPTPVALVAIDTDRHQGLAVEQGVSGIPDVRLYVDGRQVGGFTGFRPLPQAEKWLADRLALAGAPR